MIRSILISSLLLASALAAAEPPPALASLTYSGDQAALEALDRDITAADKDATKLAALEDSLLALLRRTDTTFASRQAICQRLGTVLAQSAPKAGRDPYKPLGAMLVDERDSDLARLALEPAPGAVVDTLFVAALGKTSGRTRLGIINSIARRRIEGAVPALATLLAEADATTAAAAAHALGLIGTTAADAALRAATTLAPALIGHARLQATTRQPVADAQRVLRELEGDTKLPPALRTAAFRRSLDLESSTSIPRITEILGGSDWTMKQAALEALAGGIGAGGIRTLTAKLATWDAPTQTAIIAALARTGDANAVPAVLAATKHASAEVRTEAFAALGFLPGNNDVVALLAATAGDDHSPDAKIARTSLTRLNGPGVSAAILAGAEKGPAPLRTVFLEQLALRNMTEGLPLLLKCRGESEAAVRAAAVGALGDLAPFSEQKAVLDWALAATDDTEQGKALRALVNLTLRNPATTERGTAIYSALAAASTEAAQRLLPALARLGGTASADCAAGLALRNDPKLAMAAVDTLGRWTDSTALSALADVAEKAALDPIKDSARQGALRALDRNRENWTAQTTTLVSRLLSATTTAAPRRQLLAVLARANDATALKLAEELQTDASVGEEARYTATAIKAALAGAPKLRASPASGVSNILDGKTSNRWSAPLLGEEWIEIDFRQSRSFRRLTLDQTGRTGEFPEKYEVYVSDSPEVVGSAVAKGQGQRNKTVIELPAGTKGRYVTIKNTAERKDGTWSICELFVD